MKYIKVFFLSLLAILLNVILGHLIHHVTPVVFNLGLIIVAYFMMSDFSEDRPYFLLPLLGLLFTHLMYFEGFPTFLVALLADIASFIAVFYIFNLTELEDSSSKSNNADEKLGKIDMPKPIGTTTIDEDLFDTEDNFEDYLFKKFEIPKPKFPSIGYEIPNFDAYNSKVGFPKVFFPEANAPIKFPKKGRAHRRGYTEVKFESLLKNCFTSPFEIQSNAYVPTKNGNSYYEPDIIIAYKKNGLNVYLDIEIDEPYDGFSRNPIHEIGSDDIRNKFFTKRGWIVMRFAEIQIHQEPKKCCELIMKVLAAIIPSYQYPVNYENEIEVINAWNSLQAKKWSAEKYREKYLGIQSFGSISEIEDELEIIHSEEDKLIESLIKDLKLPRKPKKAHLESENPVLRDRRLKFDPKKHKYFIDENPDTISVSELVSKFFPEFDIDHWAPIKAAYEGITVEEKKEKYKRNGEEKARLGTLLHKQIENYYNNQPYDNSTPEFKHFLNFINRYPSMKPFRSEWRVFDEKLLLAGTIDMVYIKPNGDLYLFDWKRSEKVIDYSGKIQNQTYEFGLGDLEHLGANAFNKYSLAVNIYKRILEENYNVKVSSMNLLILHEKYSIPHRIEVPLMNKEVEFVLNSRKRNLA